MDSQDSQTSKELAQAPRFFARFKNSPLPRFLAFVRPHMKLAMAAAVMGIVKFNLPLAFPLAFKYIIDVLVVHTHKLTGLNAFMDRWCIAIASALGLSISMSSKLASHHFPGGFGVPARIGLCCPKPARTRLPVRLSARSKHSGGLANSIGVAAKSIMFVYSKPGNSAANSPDSVLPFELRKPTAHTRWRPAAEPFFAVGSSDQRLAKNLIAHPLSIQN